MVEGNDGDDASYSQQVATCEEVTILYKYLTRYKCQDECTAPSLMVLKNVRDLAAQKRFSNAKQLTLGTYFHSTPKTYLYVYTVL